MTFAAVDIGAGTITGPDIVILALFLRVVFGLYKKEIKPGYVLPLLLMLAFIFFGSTLAFLHEHNMKVVYYRSVIGIACYYSICLAMLLLTEKEAKYVINFAIFTACAGIGVQTYLIYTQNNELLIAFNRYYQQIETAGQLQAAFNKGNIPRVLPSGTLLIAMCSGYALARSITSSRIFLAIRFAILYLVLTFFLLTTGTRGFVAGSLAVLCYTVYSVRKTVTISRKLILFFLLPAGLFLSATLVINNNIFSTLVERSVDFQQRGYYDAGLEYRFQQGLEALGVIADAPLGIGATRPLNLGGDVSDGMWDINSFLVIGFLGGIPAIICLFWFLIRLYKQYRKREVSVEILACGVALSYAMILTVFSLSFAFTIGENVIAFSLFAGYILRNRLRTSDGITAGTADQNA